MCHMWFYCPLQHWRSSSAEITFYFICFFIYMKQLRLLFFCFRPELHLFEHNERQTEDPQEDLQESGMTESVVIVFSYWLCVWSCWWCDVTQSVVNDAVCDVTQGVVVSDEELRRTFLQREEAEPQQGEEPVDGFRHPDLLGKTAPHMPCKPHFNSFLCSHFKWLNLAPVFTLELTVILSGPNLTRELLSVLTFYLTLHYDWLFNSFQHFYFNWYSWISPWLEERF